MTDSDEQSATDDGSAGSPPTDDGSAPAHPHIRSFGTRKAHRTPGQREAWERLLPVWGVPYAAQLLELVQVFGRVAPTVLEIGCGMGETTAAIAAANPERNFLGVEVYPAGVGALLKRIEDQGLTNLRVIAHDAVEVVRDMIAPDSLAGVHIYFPDPWPKARHHKRRLVQPAFIALLASRIAPGGTLHCATDWEPYAAQMLEVLTAEPLLSNTATGYAPRPELRPLTKFERRGLGLGHEVRDLVFVRR